MDADQQLGEILTAFETLTADLDATTEAPLDDLGRRYDMVLRIRTATTELRDALEIALIETMPEDTLTMDGVVVKREKSTRSTWKDGGAGRMTEDIGHGIATKLATDVGTGEVDPVRRNLMKNAIDEVWKVIYAPSNMKKAGRESLGLKISEYRDYNETNVIKVSFRDEG